VVSGWSFGAVGSLSRIVKTSVALISFFGFALAALLSLYAVMAWIGNRSYTGVLSTIWSTDAPDLIGSGLFPHHHKAHTG
jgi:hypothetical protein